MNMDMDMDSSCFTGSDNVSISNVHEDILRTHILTKLDGQTLASAACASKHLHSLSTSDDNLWSHICASTWPSTKHPRVHDVVSDFPSGYRSFFSDSFPSFEYDDDSSTSRLESDSEPTPVLISAVDLFYEDEVVFSKVEVTETDTDWFSSSPFRVDLLDPKETVLTSVDYQSVDNNFEECLTLSWIVVDPTRKRSVNLSSTRPVSVKRHWLTGDVLVKYAVVVPMGSGHVSFTVEVTCGGKEGGKVHVSGVSMHVEDVDGKSLSGKDSLVIIRGATEGRRKRREEKGEERKRYEAFVETRRERKERENRREKSLDMVCVAAGVGIFMAVLSFLIF